jgi:hypothetical protein
MSSQQTIVSSLHRIREEKIEFTIIYKNTNSYSLFDKKSNYKSLIFTLIMNWLLKLFSAVSEIVDTLALKW